MQLLLQNYILYLWFELILRVSFLSPGISLPTILTICLYSWLLKYSKILRNPDKNHTGRQSFDLSNDDFWEIRTIVCLFWYISNWNYLKSSSFVQSLPWTFHWLHLQHFLTPLWVSISIQKQCIPLPDGSWLQSFCILLLCIIS